MKHVIIALYIQAILAVLGMDLWAGAAVGTAFFVGREYTQAEYRWIERYGGGVRANMHWRDPFRPEAWTIKGITDFVCPAVATFLAAWLVPGLR